MKRLAKRIEADGMTFDSIAEHERWCDLKNMERGGLIRILGRQVRYPLAVDGRPVKIRSKGYPNGRQCVYTADFVYEEKYTGEFSGTTRWRLVIEENKGYDTDTARLRRAVFEAQHNTLIRMTGAQKTRKRRRAA